MTLAVREIFQAPVFVNPLNTVFSEQEALHLSVLHSVVAAVFSSNACGATIQNSSPFVMVFHQFFLVFASAGKISGGYLTHILYLCFVVLYALRSRHL